jgi:membrane protease subunit HflK
VNPGPAQPPPEPELKGLSGLEDALRTIFAVVKIGMIALALAFLFSGVTTLGQNEQALVLRFGEKKDEIRSEPGLIWALPFPIDSVVRLPAGRTDTLETSAFLPKESATASAGVSTVPPPSLNPAHDGALLCAGLDLVHCSARLQYRRAELQKALIDSDPQTLQLELQKALEAALLRAAAGLSREECLKQQALSSAALDILRPRAKELGIDIQLLELQASLPRQLDLEYSQLSKARQEAVTTASDADTYVRNTDATSINDAQRVSYETANQITNRRGRAEANLKIFTERLAEWKRHPEATRELLLNSRLKEALDAAEEIFIVEEGQDMRHLVPRRELKPKSMPK